MGQSGTSPRNTGVPVSHRRIVVRGLVQGVWYRRHTREQALELGLSGWVMNRPDGSVLIEAEGAPKALDRLEAWCWQGPPKARVEDVKSSTGAVQGLQGFDVRH